MGIIMSALAAAGDAGVQSMNQNIEQQNKFDLQQHMQDLETVKAKEIALYQNQLQNAPSNRAGKYLSDAASEQVPVQAAPVKQLSGNDSANTGDLPFQDGKGLSTTADPTLLARIQALPDDNPDKAPMLAQLQRQAASDQQAAQDAVAGQTRSSTMQEALQKAIQKAAQNGDAQAYATLKQLAGDKYMTVPDGGAIFDTTTGSIAGAPGMSKFDRQMAVEDRRDQRAEINNNAREDRLNQSLASRGNPDTPFIKELKTVYPNGGPEYDEALRQHINKEIGINGAGGRATVYNGRIIASGNEIAAALNNITQLPVGSNAGFMGFGQSNGSSILSAGVAGLKNELNSDEIKTYNTMWTGISRNLGTLETSGLATTGNLVASIDKLAFVPGDNGYNALRKLAEVRQITDAALDPKLADPNVPQQQKQFIQGVLDKVAAAVPYTHADLTKFKNAQDKNPSLTFSDFAKQNNIGSSSSAQSTNTNASYTYDPATGTFH